MAAQEGRGRSPVDPRLLDKLREARRRFQDVEAQLSDPAVLGSPERLRDLSQERAHLEDVANAAVQVDAVIAELQGASQLAGEAEDAEMRALAEDEVRALEQ